MNASAESSACSKTSPALADTDATQGRRLGPHAAREVGVVLVDRGVHEVPDGRLESSGLPEQALWRLRCRCVTQRCQAQPWNRRETAATSPAWLSETTRRTPASPRSRSPPRNAAQESSLSGVDHVAAQEVLAPVGAQPDRGHDALRDDRRADPAAHVGGVEPQVAARRARQVAAAELLHLGVEVGQRLETSELDSEDMPSLDATRSTLRVDTPHTYISCTMEATGEVSTRDHRSSMPSG